MRKLCPRFVREDYEIYSTSLHQFRSPLRAERLGGAIEVGIRCSSHERCTLGASPFQLQARQNLSIKELQLVGKH